MNARTRIALTAAAATVLTATSLWPLVQPTSWLVEATFLLLLLTGTGVLTRRVSLPRPLTVLAQLIVAVVLLTVFFADDAAVYHLLPGPAALHRLAGIVTSGVDDMSHFSTPAPATVGLRLLLTLAVLGIGLLVDVLAVTYQRVALAGLPLLALYAVGTGIHPHGPIWLWFLLSAFGFLTLLMAEGRDRVARWGRVFHGSAGTMAGQSTSPLTASGFRISALAVVGGLLLPLLLPSVGTGIVADLGGGSNGPGNGNGVITAVDPLASLAVSLQQNRSTPVLSYRTTSNDPSDQYLRIVDLEQFNGVSWSTGTQRALTLPTTLGTPEDLAGWVRRTQVKTEVTTQHGYVQQWLPMPYPATGLQVQGDWRWEPEGRTVIGGSNAQTASDLDYVVDSLSLHPTQDQLRGVGPAPDPIKQNYLALPANLPPVVGDTARAVTAGAASDIDKALALQDWFTQNGGFSYNTKVPVSTGPNALADFLSRKQGFCVHFASTMAAMARSLHIPARVAVGFAPGHQQADGSWLVTTTNAHAWPELYFTGVGWLRFEPTPSIGVPPGYGSAASQPTTNPTTGATTAPGPQASSTAHNPACTAQQRRLGDCGRAQTDTGTGHPASALSATSPLGLAGWSLAGLVVLLLLVPMLWRLRARSARLRRGPTGLTDQQVLAAWRELIDTAWDLGIPPDDAETPRHTAARISELGELGPGPSAAAGRLALATEQVLYAPEVSVPLSLRQDVREVRDGLAASSDRRTRLRAVVLPPSSSRLYRGAWRRTRARVADRTRRGAAALWSRLRPRR
ncbi:transglutaminase-like putative cysteine protease [Streptacidiphilus sp. MAP12-20]|uniref:transglutaminase TgpA family protein n=1 Tax=Streptacidiphilus sp. MAP12-20 TaxID=3156299 RepID=UPI003514736E